MPLWLLLPLPAAAAVATGLASDMAQLEAAASRRLWPRDLGYLLVGLCAAAGLLAVALPVAGVGHAVPVALRNLVLWAGVAALSGRVFGRRLAWVLPLGALFPVDWFGHDLATVGPLWWAVPLRPISAGTAAVAVAVFAAGTTAAMLTPWRAGRLTLALLPVRAAGAHAARRDMRRMCGPSTDLVAESGRDRDLPRPSAAPMYTN
jgi:hypothetical protein